MSILLAFLAVSAFACTTWMPDSFGGKVSELARYQMRLLMCIQPKDGMYSDVGDGVHRRLADVAEHGDAYAVRLARDEDVRLAHVCGI